MYCRKVKLDFDRKLQTQIIIEVYFPTKLTTAGQESQWNISQNLYPGNSNYAICISSPKTGKNSRVDLEFKCHQNIPLFWFLLQAAVHKSFILSERKNTFGNLHFCLLEEVLKRRRVLKKDIHFIVRTTISVRVKAPARLQKMENQQRTLHILALNRDHHSIHSTQVWWEQYNSFFHSLWTPRQKSRLHSDVLYLYLQYLFPVKLKRVSVFTILYTEHILNEWIHFHFLCFNSGWLLFESVVEVKNHLAIGKQMYLQCIMVIVEHEEWPLAIPTLQCCWNCTFFFSFLKLI